MILTIVTFDSAGRRVPFNAAGYFRETDTGIDYLTDPNRAGKADLIYMNYSDGYWITNAYTVNKARWQRLSRVAGRRLPLYTRFTNHPRNRAVIPP
jgi:hypothetical protein